ncbi:hypothetical protein NL676_034884 [Syzygium grande]|nr:hypothetical protein NL676_034884 [Syzygium grande]
MASALLFQASNLPPPAATPHHPILLRPSSACRPPLALTNSHRPREEPLPPGSVRPPRRPPALPLPLRIGNQGDEPLAPPPPRDAENFSADPRVGLSGHWRQEDEVMGRNDQNRSSTTLSGAAYVSHTRGAARSSLGHDVALLPQETLEVDLTIEVVFGVWSSQLQQMVEMGGYEIGNSPARYLGICLISGKLSDRDCKVLTDRILRRIPRKRSHKKFSNSQMKFMGVFWIVPLLFYYLRARLNGTGECYCEMWISLTSRPSFHLLRCPIPNVKSLVKTRCSISSFRVILGSD